MKMDLVALPDQSCLPLCSRRTRHSHNSAPRICSRYEDALTDFTAALKVKPDFYQAHCGRSEVLAAQEKYEESVAAAEDGIKVNAEESQA